MSTTTSGTSTSQASSSPSSSASTPPELPSRPNSLNSSAVSRTTSTYSPYGASRLGTSPYGTYGAYGSYTSPYSRFGGMYGAYGGYGGMYGGYGGMYGGMAGDPNDPNSLAHSFSQSTQATFQIIESIVGAFGGFAQMLESTYMATHSSFFGMLRSCRPCLLVGIGADCLPSAMVAVAEQLGNLRNTLGQALGIFTMIRWFKTLIAKLTGRPLPADATSLTPSAFAAFMRGRSSGTLPDGSPRPSKKPFLMFLMAVFGLPYLMGKLIRALARSQEEEARRQQRLLEPGQQQAPLDPSKLDFCRVLYDYSPDAHNTAGIDLAVKKGDIVAVLSKTDPLGNPSEWWRCRARDGRVGYLPSPYLETIQRRPTQAITTGSSAASSRTATMSTMSSKAEEQAKSEKPKAEEKKPEIKRKMGDISPESFQKGAFYS